MGYRGIGLLHYHMDIPSNDLCCLDVRSIERLVILLLLYSQPRLSYLYTFDILQAILLNCIENQLYNIHIVYMRLMA
jgi:hypothetical protein